MQYLCGFAGLRQKKTGAVNTCQNMPAEDGTLS